MMGVNSFATPLVVSVHRRRLVKELASLPEEERRAVVREADTEATFGLGNRSVFYGQTGKNLRGARFLRVHRVAALM